MSQPRRPDEREMYARLRALGKQPGRVAIQALAVEMAMPDNRCFYLLEKWYGKGWWDYGMWAWGGWFTDQAPDSI